MAISGGGSDVFDGAIKEAEKLKAMEQVYKRMVDKMDEKLDSARYLGQSEKKNSTFRYDLKESLDRDIESLEGRLQKIKECREKLNKLTLREGDVAYYPNLGNVLIRKYIHSEHHMTGLKKDWDGEIVAEIVHRDGQEYVLASDLLPINETTKVLYGTK